MQNRIPDTRKPMKFIKRIMQSGMILTLLAYSTVQADDSSEIQKLKQQLSQLQEQLEQTNRTLERLDQQPLIKRFNHQDWAGDLSRFQFGREPRPMVGIVMMNSDGEPGVRIAAVTPDGPADKAGIQSGDRIINIAGEPISDQNPVETVNRLLDDMKAGDVYAMTLERDGDIVDVDVTIEELTPRFAYRFNTGNSVFGPDSSGFSFDFSVDDVSNLKQLEDLLYRFKPVGVDALKGYSSGRFPGAFRFGWQWSGLELSELNPDLAGYFSTSSGVLVIHADLEDTTLKGGDVILSVSGDDVDTPTEVMDLLSDIRPGKEAEMVVMRRGQLQQLRVTAPERVGSGYFYTWPDDE